LDHQNNFVETLKNNK